MNTLRFSLVLGVLGASVLLTLWVLGWIDGAEVVDSTARTIALIAIGGAASGAVFALLSGRRSPADQDPPPGPPTNGPRF